ncbi:MAG TPA: hypothetical protein VFD08_03840 [Clostridia bacterium]|nr:hypothetical protein [Clostridia bacterium]
MTIIYDGKNLAGLCGKLSLDELAILSSRAQPQAKEAIYYMEKDQDPQMIKDFPPGWAVEMEAFDESLPLDYKDRIFTRDFKKPPLLGKICLWGSFDGVESLCKYLASSSRISFGISGDSHRVQRLREISKNRADHFDGQPLHMVLGMGEISDTHLYLWDGSLDELYRLREYYEELPRYHYMVQRGYLGKSFQEQAVIHGRYLGRISKKGWKWEWKKIIEIISSE